MVAKRKQASTAPASFRRNKIGPLEEIPFDFAAREEYLTGFHKRKLQRAKHAQEQAAKREREERIATRKAVSVVGVFYAMAWLTTIASRESKGRGREACPRNQRGPERAAGSARVGRFRELRSMGGDRRACCG